mgnify:FL=1
MSKKVQSDIYGDITHLQYLLIGKESNITLNHHIISIFGEDPSKNYLPSEMYNILKPDFPEITEDKVTQLLDNLVKQNNLQRILSTQKSTKKPDKLKELKNKNPYMLTKTGRLTHKTLLRLKDMEFEIKTQFDNVFFKNIKEALEIILSNLKHVTKHKSIDSKSADSVLKAIDTAQQSYDDIAQSVNNLKVNHAEIQSLIADFENDTLLKNLKDFIKRMSYYIKDVYNETFEKDNIIQIQNLTESLKSYNDITFYDFYDEVMHKTSINLEVIIIEGKNDLYSGNIERAIKRTKLILNKHHIIDNIDTDLSTLLYNVMETLKMIRDNMKNKHQQSLFIRQAKELNNIDTIEEAHQLFENQFNTIEINHFNSKHAEVNTKYDLIFLDTSEKKQIQRVKPKKQYITQSKEDIKRLEQHRKERQQQIELFNNKVKMLFDDNGLLKSTYINDEDIFSRLQKDIVQAIISNRCESTLGQSTSNFTITIERIDNDNQETIIESPTRKITTSKVVIRRKDVY